MFLCDSDNMHNLSKVILVNVLYIYDNVISKNNTLIVNKTPKLIFTS